MSGDFFLNKEATKVTEMRRSSSWVILFSGVLVGIVGAGRWDIFGNKKATKVMEIRRSGP